MSSYIDHREARAVAYDLPDGRQAYRIEAVTTHSWATFTEDRLDWLYGVGRQDTPAARADLAAWNALGSDRKDAA